MNKRLKKKRYKNCENCKLFEKWDIDSGQYDEYGRCELPPYRYPVCKKSEILEEYYNLPLGGDFEEQIKEITGKAVCKFFTRK